VHELVAHFFSQRDEPRLPSAKKNMKKRKKKNIHTLFSRSVMSRACHVPKKNSYILYTSIHYRPARQVHCGASDDA